MSRRTIVSVVHLAVVAVILGACGGGDSAGGDPTIDSGSAAATTPVTTTSAPPPATEPVVTEPPVVTDPATTTTTEAPDVQGPPMFAGLDDQVVLLTPESDGGTRPRLEWEAVADAKSYTVVLYAPSGQAYWSWTGAATAVHVGGEPQLRDDAPGPSITDDMSWAVIAHDVNGAPIAVSAQRPISP